MPVCTWIRQLNLLCSLVCRVGLKSLLKPLTYLEHLAWKVVVVLLRDLGNSGGEGEDWRMLVGVLHLHLHHGVGGGRWGGGQGGGEVEAVLWGRTCKKCECRGRGRILFLMYFHCFFFQVACHNIELIGTYSDTVLFFTRKLGLFVRLYYVN